MDQAIVQRIKDSIASAKTILINVHRNPDLDTVGSAVAMYRELIKMGKRCALVCPDNVPREYLFLPEASKIETIDFSSFDFSTYDLFLVIDTGSASQLTGSKSGTVPTIKTIVIDHHIVNTLSSEIKLIDVKASSSAEIIYNLFEDWNLSIDKETADALVTGILADTQMFRFSGNNPTPLKVVAELMERGVDVKPITKVLFENEDPLKIKMYGQLLASIKVMAGRYVMSSMPYEEYETFGKPKGVRNAVSDFIRGVKGVQFSVVAVEEKKGELSLSFRSTSFDVANLASRLGGGGHTQAAGATILATYEEALRILEDSLKG